MEVKKKLGFQILVSCTLTYVLRYFIDLATSLSPRVENFVREILPKLEILLLDNGNGDSSVKKKIGLLFITFSLHYFFFYESLIQMPSKLMKTNVIKLCVS